MPLYHSYSEQFTYVDPEGVTQFISNHPRLDKNWHAYYTTFSELADTDLDRAIALFGWALCDDITNPVVGEERIIESRAYRTIKEVKNGQGPAPIKSPIGWIHLAHGGTRHRHRPPLRALLLCYRSGGSHQSDLQSRRRLHRSRRRRTTG